MALTNDDGYEVASPLANAIEKIVNMRLALAGVSVPAGGSAGQVLTKFTGNDYETGWKDPTATATSGPTNIDGGTATPGSASNIDGGTA